MGRENYTGPPTDTDHYEPAPLTDLVEHILICSRRQSIQDMLDALANDGFYVVRRKKQSQ